MIKIDVDGGIEKALKKLKRKFRDYKIPDECRERREYTKKSVKKRQEKKKAIYIDKKFNNNEN